MLASKTRRALLTDEAVSRIEAPPSGELRIWDTELTGFCLRVHASGRASFCFKHSLDGKPTWLTLGAAGALGSADKAREEVVRLSNRSAPRPKLHRTAARGFTVATLVERYLVEGPLMKLDKRPSSWKADASNLRRHVVPLLGHRPAAAVSQEEVAEMVLAVSEGRYARTIQTKKQGVARITGGSGTAQRVLQTFAAVFAWAIKRGLLGYNPAKGLRLPKRPPMERYLTPAEAGRMFKALKVLEDEDAIRSLHGDAIRLLLLTGARKGEIVGLRWSEVDFGRRCLVLPPDRSKTGGKLGVRRINLGDPAVAILNRIPRTTPYVFPSCKGASPHFTSIDKVWGKVRERAALGQMRIHDLRHSFASFAVQGGENITLIRDALGHTTLRMTERYMHLSDEAGRGFSQRMARSIAEFANDRAA